MPPLGGRDPYFSAVFLVIAGIGELLRPGSHRVHLQVGVEELIPLTQLAQHGPVHFIIQPDHPEV